MTLSQADLRFWTHSSLAQHVNDLFVDVGLEADTGLPQKRHGTLALQSAPASSEPRLILTVASTATFKASVKSTKL
jgi:hypothetical protein